MLQMKSIIITLKVEEFDSVWKTCNGTLLHVVMTKLFMQSFRKLIKIID